MAEHPVILVVDDDASILLLMRSLLREFGFDPVTAASGKQALEAARRRTPDLVLLDRNMPGMSGDEVLGAMRSDGALSSIPVLMLTGEPMEQDEIRNLGATAAVLKPFDVGALVEMIRAQLKAEGRRQKAEG
jgi:DNA-binding response OmpR family regulator